jgi:hypothetical protein
MSCRVFNVDRCIHVGMRGVTAACGLAPEDRLAFAVALGDKAAGGASLRRVRGMDLHHACARVPGRAGQGELSGCQIAVMIGDQGFEWSAAGGQPFVAGLQVGSLVLAAPNAARPRAPLR